MKARELVDLGAVLNTGRELDLKQLLVIPSFEAYSFPDPVAAELVVRRSGRGVAVVGTLLGTASSECARCLELAPHPFDLAVDERFDTDDVITDPLAESNVLVDGKLDVRDLARQLIDSALPMILVCDDACPGLCPVCGSRIPLGGPCHPEVGDHG